MRSDVTISVNSQVEGSLLDRREPGVDWASQRSGQEAKVDSVEVFLLSVRSVEVDVSFWVFLIHSHVHGDGSLEKSGGSDSMISVSSVFVDRFRRNCVWHENSGSQHSWVPPSLSGFSVDLVVDGDVGFPEAGLLECGPETRFGGWSDGSWVLGRVLLFSALFVWPSVRSSLILLCLGSVGLLGQFDFRSSLGAAFLGVLTPDNVDGPLVSWLVNSLEVEEVSSLGGLGSEVDADSSGLFSSLGSKSGLNFDLLESSLDKGNNQVKSLGLGNSTSVLEVQGGLDLNFGSELFLRVGFVLDNSGLSFDLLEDGLGIRVLGVPELKSASLGGWREEERLEHVSGSKTEESQRSS